MMETFRKFISLFLFPALLLSCDKGTAVEESISVSPSTIAATYTLASYEAALSSNVSWTAELSGEGDVDPSWISLSKSQGSGDSKITIRVVENKYSSVRKASVKFTTASGKSALLSITQDANPGGPESKSVSLRLGSYNLRMHNIDTDESNKWDVRKERLLQSIKENSFDIFGVQEVSTVTQSWLKTNLGTEYDFFFFSPYSQGGEGDKAQGILFRKSLFSISDKHFFWASDTPETCSLNDTGNEGSYRRGGHCAVFTHKGTGIKLFFMNTHGCLNKQPNIDNAHVYVDMEKKYNSESLPSFFVGDMNARPDLASTTTYKAHWNDSYDKAKKRSSAAGTYNGYKYPSGNQRIDYVYFRGSGIAIDEFIINTTLYGGMYASDHFPITAIATITP